MKYKITFKTLLLLLLGSTAGLAQTTVPARDIIEKARKGESVAYENATITGGLDFTLYFEKRNEEKYSEKRSRWSDNDNTIEERYTGQIVFKNCTFKGGVLAYINDERTDFTFTASFDNTVVFKDCKFEEESAFKYSVFDKAADFTNCAFSEEALFKYAKFNRFANFKGATFEDEANFKYAKFRDGLDFSNTTFQGDLNLKYAKVDGEFHSENMDIQDDLDVKYTEINGESFSKYLLKLR